MIEPITKDSPHWIKCRWFMAQSSAFAAAPKLTDNYLSDLSTDALNAILSNKSTSETDWQKTIKPIEIVRLVNYIRALENRAEK